MSKLYVQYGCGLSAPENWLNFDASPTLRLQKTPLVGFFLKKSLNVIFPENVKYGDILKGLPVSENSCDGVYCSHTLEHLSLNDFTSALKNTYKILKSGGIFRCIVPDLEWAVKEYVNALSIGDKMASVKFMQTTLLGIENRSNGIKGLIASSFGNSHHLWMWDDESLTGKLEETGFNNIRPCYFNDCKDEMFKYVESEGRFLHAVALECTKP
jgi:SAM-dependent methyltransferase